MPARLARLLRLDDLPEEVLLHLGAEHVVGEVDRADLLAFDVEDVDLHGRLAPQVLISTSTPADRSSFISASSVCCVGSRMSSSRLCVRISNCSRDFLSTCGERSTVYLLILVGSGIGPATLGAGALGRLHDLARRLVEQLVIVGLETNADLGCHWCHFTWLFDVRQVYARILVTTPAPTVLPPSRIAKRRSSSQAIGVMQLDRPCSMLSPGITISTPSGSVTVPVTSVVRK